MTSSLGATSSGNTPPTAEDPYQAHLNDSDFAKLSDKLKRVTWVIKVDSFTEEPTYCTGFAIKLRDSVEVKDEDLVLMTCAHVVNNNSGITVRNIDGEDFILEATILNMKLSWDLSLLIVKDGNVGAEFAEFAQDGTITNCQTLLHVGHAGCNYDLVWSVFIGRSLYQCLNDCLPVRKTPCGSYECLSLNETPKYRIMGHIWNKVYFQENEPTRFPYEKNISAEIPIIQCAGLLCEGICSGGPVFNCQGHIVGMIIGEVDNCEVAIHMTLLKEFVKNSTTTEDATKKRKQPDT